MVAGRGLVLQAQGPSFNAQYQRKKEIPLPLNKNSKTMVFIDCVVGGMNQGLSALQGVCFWSNPVFWDWLLIPRLLTETTQTGNFPDYSDFFSWNRKTVKLWLVATYILQALARACKQQPVNSDKRTNLVILAS